MTLAPKNKPPQNAMIDAAASILQAFVKGMGNKKRPAGTGQQNTNIAGCGGCSAKK
jgi:hypothetical protein